MNPYGTWEGHVVRILDIGDILMKIMLRIWLVYFVLVRWAYKRDCNLRDTHVSRKSVWQYLRSRVYTQCGIVNIIKTCITEDIKIIVWTMCYCLRDTKGYGRTARLLPVGWRSTVWWRKWEFQQQKQQIFPGSRSDPPLSKLSPSLEGGCQCNRLYNVVVVVV
jgi:hypothetical protein